MSGTEPSTATGIPRPPRTWWYSDPRASGQRPASLGPAKDDDHVVRPHAIGEQACDLPAHGLGLAAVATALDEGDAPVGLHPRAGDGEQATIELAERRAGRVGRVEGKLLDDLGIEVRAEAGQEPGPRDEGVVVLVVDGHGHVTGGAEGAEELQLLLGQIVEPVDEHRP
jgi:hypothetical protein